MTPAPDAPRPARPVPSTDDETADLLRAVLHREAEAVRPTDDALARILAAAATPDTGSDRPGPHTVELPVLADPRPPGAAERRGLLRSVRGRPLGARRPGTEGRGPSHWPAVLSTAAAVALLVGGFGVAHLGAPSVGEVGSPVVSRSLAARPSAPIAAPLPVYLISRQAGRWALVREFTTTELTDPTERLDAALRLAVAGIAADPDLTSAWAALGVPPEAAPDAVHGEAGPDGLTVRLDAPVLDVDSTSSERRVLAGLAVQQMVWTATAVTARFEPVRVEAGTSGDSLFGVEPLGRAVSRGTGRADPRAPVWINSLTDGRPVPLGEDDVTGDAVTGRSGTVPWTLTGPDGAVVGSGTAQLTREDGSRPQLGERAVFTVHLALREAGRYRLEVSQDWPDPTGRRPAWVDSKTLWAD